MWGDEPPHPRLIAVYAHQLTAFDRALAERLADADPVLQRSVARWAARRAVTAAGLDQSFPKVALALEHLERGESLPAPFDRQDGSEFALLDTGEEVESFMTVAVGWWGDEEEDEQLDFPEVPATAESSVSKDVITVDNQPNCSRPHYTLPVIREAADPDPLRAATQALWTAACSFGDEHRRSILRECSQLLGDRRP